MRKKYLKSFVNVLPIALLVACGGGSSSDVSDNVNTGDTTTVTANSSYSPFSLSDSYSGSSFSGNGYGYGGDTGDGSADAGGAAGDGEFIRLRGRFPTTGNTSILTWTVLRSQYGIQDSSGTLTVEPDLTANGGGYKVLSYTINGGASQSARPKQSNIFVSAKGQISGTLPLPINGVRDAAFTAMRFADSKSTTVDFADYAGSYVFAQMAADKGTGLDKSTAAGIVKINSDGSGRICPSENWSSTCPDGADIKLSYDDALDQRLVRIQAAATQTVPIPTNGRNQLDVLAVFRKFEFPNGSSNDGLSFTADWLSWDSRSSSSAQRTGIAYASRIGTVDEIASVNLNSTGSDFVGAWNYVGSPVSGSTYKAYARAEVISGSLKVSVGSGVIGTPCTETWRFSQDPMLSGVAKLTSVSNSAVGYGVLIDSDTFVYINPEYEIGIARRYSGDSGSGPAGACTP